MAVYGTIIFFSLWGKTEIKQVIADLFFFFVKTTNEKEGTHIKYDEMC